MNSDMISAIRDEANALSQDVIINQLYHLQNLKSFVESAIRMEEKKYE